MQVYDFYTNLNMFYGVLTEFCTPTRCTTMAAGNTYETGLILLIQAHRSVVRSQA